MWLSGFALPAFFLATLFGKGFAPRLKADQMLKIKEIVDEVCRDTDLDLLDILYIPGKRRGRLRIIIDNETSPVSLSDCERVSRKVSRLLDVEDPISGAYQLEVSSPGFKRLLRIPKDIPRFLQHRIRVKLNTPLEGRKTWIGVLHSADDPLILKTDEIGEIQIPHRIILKANLDD